MGKVFWAGALVDDGRPRSARGRARAARARPQGARPPVPHKLDGGRGRVRLLAPARSGRLLRADPARLPRRPPPSGRRMVGGQGGDAGRGSRGRARPPLPPGARAHPRRRPDDDDAQSWRPGRSATSHSPASGRCRSTSTRAEHTLARALELAPAGAPGARPPARALGAGGAAARPTARGKDGARGGARLYREQGDGVAAGRVADRALDRARRAGRPARGGALAEAIALLEAQPPGPELVAAYADSRAPASPSAPTPKPSSPPTARSNCRRARAPGARAAPDTRGALALLGDGGLDDLRRASCLPSSREGREAAVLHNNLASRCGCTRGRSRPHRCREGIDFCERRGIAEFTLAIAAIDTDLRCRGVAGRRRRSSRRGAGRAPGGGGDIFFTSRAPFYCACSPRGAQMRSPRLGSTTSLSRPAGER